uniref:Uncharacterized protein n=1 Tax=Mola mola TaxID=94237 RepID=A0A3Q4ARB8_MOLML
KSDTRIERTTKARRKTNGPQVLVCVSAYVVVGILQIRGTAAGRDKGRAGCYFPLILMLFISLV